MDRIARLALLPILLLQGLWLRRQALILPEAEGPRQGNSGSGPTLRLLVLGDSSAAGVGVAHQDQALMGHLVRDLSRDHHLHWQLLARTGTTTRDAIQMLDQADLDEIDAVVLALGVNDVTGAVPRAHWLSQQRSLLDRLEFRHGAATVLVTQVPPMGRFPLLPQPLRWVLGKQASRFERTRRRHLSDRSGCHPLTLDLPEDPTLMAKDGFHPGPALYATWAKQAAQQIRDTLK